MNLDKKTKIKFNILAIICVIIFSAVLTPITFQNDTFYTIKIGEDILSNGIDMQDHYSWHENLPYTYPHWAYDVGTYLIYNLGQSTGIENGGFLFLTISVAILASTLGVLIYITSSKVSKNNLISFILTILVMYLFKDYIAARAQLVTFNLFVLTILFIESFLDSRKKRYLVGLVIISIIIANVHVAVWPFFFVLFLPYIVSRFISWVVEKRFILRLSIKIRRIIIKNTKRLISKEDKEEQIIELNKKLNTENEKLAKNINILNGKRKEPYKILLNRNTATKWLILVIVICALTGLLTPLGDTPYTYLAKTMQGNTTKSITEHQPLTLFNDKEMMVVLAITILIFALTDSKIKLEDFFMLGGLIFLLFMSRRQISMFLIIGVFIFAKWLNYLAIKYDKGGCEKVIRFMSKILGKTLTICIILFICVVFVKNKKDDVFVDAGKYPVEASQWMLENLDVDNMRLYNEYNYGSYLLFKGIPVFIDSRADLYAPEFNKDEGAKYGRDIFSDYINIASVNLYYENKFNEYDITHAMVYNNAKLNLFLSRDDNYKQIYKDNCFTIYRRVK